MSAGRGPSPERAGGRVDLSGLEQTAARLGLPGLRARVVPAERRRGRWFRWGGGELLVSERVLERLRPAEGQALLVHALLERRALTRATARWLGWTAALAVTAGWVGLWAPGARLLAALAVVAGALVALALLRGRAALAADDQAVAVLGDPELLVRALNTIEQDELHLGRWRGRARPDQHHRAERLVELHQLRLPPERRSCGRDGRRCGQDGG